MSKKQSKSFGIKSSQEVKPITKPTIKPTAAPVPKRESTPSVLSKYFLPENVFLVLGLVFGLLFGITIPPFQVPDESVHFKRVYKLSTFDIFQTETKNGMVGDYMPSNLDSTAQHVSYLSFKPYNKITKKAILEEFKHKINYNHEEFIYNSASNYFYFSYIPQFPVMVVLRLFDASIMTILYVGRFASLIFFLLFVYYAIKITPFGKYIMLVLALLPNTLQIAGSYSSDNCSNTLTFLAIAIALYLSQNINIDFRQRKVWLYLIICAVIGVIKPIYFPVAFLGLIVPITNFNKKSNFWLFNAIAIFVCLLTTGIWTYLISTLNKVPVEFAETGVDAMVQIIKLITNPLGVLLVAKKTFAYFWSFYWQGSVGILGYLDTMLKPWIYTTLYFLLFGVAILDRNLKEKINIFRSMYVTAIGLAIIFGAFLGLYIYSPTNAEIVSGIQGRYFVPGLICLFVALSTYFKFNFEIFKYKISFFLVALIVFITLFSTQGILYARYYR